MGKLRLSRSMRPVTAGAFSLTAIDTSLANPQNPCYVVTVHTKDGAQVLGPGYGCVQTAQGNSWCSAGVCNFDNFIPNLAPIALQQNGRQDLRVRKVKLDLLDLRVRKVKLGRQGLQVLRVILVLRVPLVQPERQARKVFRGRLERPAHLDRHTLALFRMARAV